VSDYPERIEDRVTEIAAALDRLAEAVEREAAENREWRRWITGLVTALAPGGQQLVAAVGRIPDAVEMLVDLAVDEDPNRQPGERVRWPGLVVLERTPDPPGET
jgi:hypothetical protein